jgi:CheY-like chemotaxis protein
MKPQHILLVDDDPKLLTLLKSSLQKEGYVTSETLDGDTALRQIETEPPDLVLADVTMPAMDGFELCRLVRENPATDQVPFIFLTAKGELHDRVKGLNLGADDYISKPFHISEVTARIKVVLQRSAKLAQAAVSDDKESDLRGNLEQMGMAEVVQTLGISRKTGGLKILRHSRVGKIYFEQGEIIQAALGDVKDEEAVYRILTWNEGYFEFDSNDTAARTIATSHNSLLMEGFQQREELAKYHEAMPPFTAMLTLSRPDQIGDLKPISQKVARLIDGHRTLQEIVDASPVNYLVTVKILYTLLKKQLAEAIELQPDQELDEDYSQLAHELYE